MKASTFLLLSLATVACHGFFSQAPRFAFRWMPSSTYVKGDTRLYEVIPQEIPAKSSETAGTVIDSPKTVGNVLFVLPHNAGEIKSNFGSRSPYGSPSILEVAQQLQRKLRWFSDLLVDADIVVLPENGDYTNDLETQALESDALIALHVTDNKDIAWLQTVFNRRSQLQLPNMCHFALESDSPPPSRCGPYDSTASSSLSPKLLLPWTNSASGKRLDEQMKGLFERWTSDDFTYAIMLFFNRFSGTEIDWCKHSIDATWEKGPWRNAKEFYNMVTKCGDCVAKCVADEQCKECLDALTALDTTDQVASYRTIVSYESELLKDFSFCILQKNNIFNCDAKIPQSPKVTPISEFRGKPLTKNIARGILIGHLDDDKALEGGDKISTSWKVAAGANVAYDQFPSQNQIFYETASGKGGMWYDPVFRVETVDGRNVWCKRHYRVRDGEVPGTFYFSVLDNGVTSNEFWTIVDVADDLSHIIFHYAGAAGAVGQRYLGGLLCTSDGSLPKELEEIYGKFRSAGIDPWELFIVDNSPDSPGALEAGEPPLDFFRKDVLAQKRRLQNDPE